MIRYAAVASNKTIFVWDADKALHSDMLKTLENWASVFKNDSVKGKNLDNRADLCVTGTAKYVGGELIHVAHDSWDAVVKKIINRETLTPAWLNEWLPKPYKSINQVKEDLDKLIKKFTWIEDYVTGFNENNGWIKLKKYFLENN